MNMFEAMGVWRRATLWGFKGEGEHTIEEWARLAQEYLYEKGIERRAESASPHNTGQEEV